MIHAQLINYVDLASSSILNLYDYAYDNNMVVNGNIVFIDLQKKKLKEYFTYRLMENISRYSTLKTVVYDTCIPSLNWRFSTDVKLVDSNLKYVVNEDDKDNVIMSGKSLDNLLNECWEELKKDRNIATIRLQHVDAYDLKQVMVDHIGREFVSCYRPEYKSLYDNNNQLHEECMVKPVPKWVEDSIKIQLNMFRI